jgi:hypothetical protein
MGAYSHLRERVIHTDSRARATISAVMTRRGMASDQRLKEIYCHLMSEVGQQFKCARAGTGM